MSELEPGVHEALVTEAIREKLASFDADLIRQADLDKFDYEEMLARFLGDLTRKVLRRAGGSDGELANQVSITNRIVEALAAIHEDEGDNDSRLVTEHPKVLLDIAENRLPDGSVNFPSRPQVALTSSALLVNGREQPQIGHEVAMELRTADRVDLLCAFVKWHGLRLIEKELTDFIDRGGRLRVITTTYMGATDAAAVERLRDLGAEVAVSYDTRRTRLHAKAWLFHRASGLDTAYVGSSNLSRSAMLDGLEWNVRLARAEQPHLIDTFAATFEEYWNDPSFEPYKSEDDRVRLKEALDAENGVKIDQLTIANIDVIPYPYQSEILDELAAAREEHSHWRNLAVMATGTGKTIVAALDYDRLQRAGTVKTLLFVAHRKEILEQSLATFRTVLKNGSFGELMVDGNRPSKWQHVFASIQSLGSLTDLEPDHFDMIIIDEFHHAAAKSYEKLLDHADPKVLLGLTATPERTDGQDILHWFDDNKPTVELRLWEALERGLLVPFHYFGIHDNVDLSGVAWRRGQGYVPAELAQRYMSIDTRVPLVVQALKDKVGNIGAMKAVGFCVSIEHANFMAERFEHHGIPSRAITSKMTSVERAEALAQLKNGMLKAVFTVDLFNEGVDVPDIDTVLFLRPTESATVFLQQLGRGLRLTKDKAVLTVLDFVGNQHREFRFDKRFTALTGIARGRLADGVEAGFPTLPAGCSIDLDREVSRIVLANIKQSLAYSIRDASEELRSLGRISLRQYLHESGRELEDLYAGDRGGWARLRREAGMESRPLSDQAFDKQLGKAFNRMLHIDDPRRLEFLRGILQGDTPPQYSEFSDFEKRMLAMLHVGIDSTKPIASISTTLERLWGNPVRKDELIEITEILQDRVHRVAKPVDVVAHLPLRLHARYTKDELLTAFGMDRPRYWVAGVRYVPEEAADVFMVTIDKSGTGFKPSTMYNDRAISLTRFQWESQGNTSLASPTGQRYINHDQLKNSIHLFIRHIKEDSGPFLYCGPMHYRSHQGENPIQIEWELEHELPADVFHYAKVTTG
ncbi:DUF3427 domain-containing protein [Glycomyces artemisiae]|nr:DEAD/DEAH box helicase [Glycomyces artemisiae]